MRILILLCAAFSLLEAKSVKTYAGECESPFIPLLDGCYYFSTVGKNWYKAMEDCNNKGARLVTIESEEENDAIKSQISDLAAAAGHTNEWWIGGYDAPQEGNFIWSGNFAHLTYTDWCNGDPNNVNVENCIHMFPGCNYQWQDYNCDFEYDYYICQKY